MAPMGAHILAEEMGGTDKARPAAKSISLVRSSFDSHALAEENGAIRPPRSAGIESAACA